MLKNGMGFFFEDNILDCAAATFENPISPEILKAKGL
jgi:hypothetical protein